MDETGESSKAPTDYDALKKLAGMGDARAATLLAMIHEEVEKHMEEFLEEISDVDMHIEQRKRIYAEEQRNFTNYTTMRVISEYPLPKEFKKDMDSEKTKLNVDHKKKKEKEEENKGKSSAQKELAEKKADLDNRTNESDSIQNSVQNTLQQPKSKTEVVETAGKNPIIKTFLQSAPVADVLVEKHNEDNEAFHEAVKDLDSPEGGKLILAMLNAITKRQGNQTTTLLLFAFDLFPELFEKLDSSQLNSVANIFEKEAIKFCGISKKELVDLNLQNCAQIPEKVENFDELPFEYRKGLVLGGVASQCRQKAIQFQGKTMTIIKDTLTSSPVDKVSDDDEIISSDSFTEIPTESEFPYDITLSEVFVEGNSLNIIPQSEEIIEETQPITTVPEVFVEENTLNVVSQPKKSVEEELQNNVTVPEEIVEEEPLSAKTIVKTFDEEDSYNHSALFLEDDVEINSNIVVLTVLDDTPFEELDFPDEEKDFLQEKKEHFREIPEKIFQREESIREHN